MAMSACSSPRLARLPEAVRQGPLEFRVSDNIEFGSSWTKGMPNPNLLPSDGWFATLPGMLAAGAERIPHPPARA